MNSSMAFRSGLLFGIVYFFGTQYWIYHSINHYGGLNLLSSISIVLLLCLYESLYTAIFCLLYSKALRKTDMPSTLIAAPLWVSLEYIRGYLFSGFPWSLIGYTQHNFIGLIQIADITGIYGVSFLVVLVNALLTDLFLLKKKKSEKPLFSLWKTFVSTFITLFIVVSVLIYGFYRINTFNKKDGDFQKIRISVIQGNINQAIKWNPEYQQEVLRIYEGLTRKALKESPALVVWPETALPFYYDSDRKLTMRLINFIKEIRTPLLTGSVIIKDKKNKKGSGRVSSHVQTLSNSAILFNRNGKPSYIYDKIHLVPFGEYVPLKNILFFIDKLVVAIGEFKAGNKYQKASTSWGQLGTLICYEVIFPGLVRKFFRDGGELIVNITNDAWFGRTTGPYQHFTMAIFRAVENRKPLVRAANTGISGFIDSTGRVTKTAGLFKERAITEVVNINKKHITTFYTRFGDLFVFFNMLISLSVFGIKSDMFNS
jgi:apolipoprotein N-acyltransferase